MPDIPTCTAADLGETGIDNARIYAAIAAASSAYASIFQQNTDLLLRRTTMRGIVSAERYIDSPLPIHDVRLLVLGEQGVLAGDLSADDALAVGGALMAVNAATLRVGGNQPPLLSGDSLTYLALDKHILQIDDSLPWQESVWFLDGDVGWGYARPLHGTGYPDTAPLAAGDREIAYTGEYMPAVGTVLQWDREVMAVSGGSGEAYNWTLTLKRGLGDSEVVGHLGTTTLRKLEPEALMQQGTALVAKWMLEVGTHPMAGPSFDPSGDTTPSVYRRVAQLGRQYMRQ